MTLPTGGAFLFADCPDHHAQGKTQDGGHQPAQVQAVQGQPGFREGYQPFQMQRALQSGGQGLDQVEDRSQAGKGGDADIHHPVVVEQLSAQGQNDQGNGGRIQEHQHRQGVADDVGQAKVGDEEGKRRKSNGPDLIAGPLGEHPQEGIRTAGHQTDGGLQTGKGDGEGQHQTARAAQVMTGDLGQGDAAVVGGLKQASGLGTHEDGGDVDQGHQHPRKNTGAQYILCNGGILRDSHAADDVNDHDAEGKTRDGIHGAVALNKGGEEGTAFVGCCRLHSGNHRAGICQGRSHQNGQEDQKQRIDDLADPHGNARRPQGKEQNQGEENAGEDQQCRTLGYAGAQHGQDAGGEGGGGAAGNGEEGADGQIQQAGEEISVSPAHFTGQSLQAVGMGIADGSHAQDGDAYCGDDEAQHGRNQIPPCDLSQMHREDQIARAEEHAEQRSGHQELLFQCQSLFHKDTSFLREGFLNIPAGQAVPMSPFYHPPCILRNASL